MAAATKKKPQITTGQIVEEALALLLETNLSGVTMRDLANRLGIKAASLYWHFPNKAALESAMSERLFLRALELAPEAADWRDWMRGVGRAVWDTLMEYPDSGLLIMSADLSDQQFERTTKTVQQRLSVFDVDQRLIFNLHSGVQALITGWVTFAHSPYTHRLENLIDIKTSAMETLDAMIEGWAARIEIR
jgi:AcrR family transcriptional regulator